MRKGILLVLMLGILAFGSIGFAATTGTNVVTINVAEFYRITVAGAASVDLVENDFFIETWEYPKALTSTVVLTVHSNDKNGCQISGRGTNFSDGTDNFTIGLLDARIEGGNFTSLATSDTQLIALSGKQSNVDLNVAFRLNAAPPTSVEAGAYTSTITYTIAPLP